MYMCTVHVCTCTYVYVVVCPVCIGSMVRMYMHVHVLCVV